MLFVLWFERLSSRRCHLRSFSLLVHSSPHDLVDVTTSVHAVVSVLPLRFSKDAGKRLGPNNKQRNPSHASSYSSRLLIYQYCPSCFLTFNMLAREVGLSSLTRSGHMSPPQLAMKSCGAKETMFVVTRYSRYGRLNKQRKGYNLGGNMFKEWYLECNSRLTDGRKNLWGKTYCVQAADCIHGAECEP